MNVAIKRAYAPPEPGDGMRILVDRLWPRGLRKQAAHIDLWLKEVAPSTALRQWFAHDPAKWGEFRRRYLAELQAGAAAEALQTLRAHARQRPLTLLYAAHDEAHNQAVVLRDLLAGHR
ncbi:DUF488 domain-containing protein [Thermomonas flagellata]|uniref:DUF488 domain-containing protein n=1 Tax=Thermomonas flagellata TaxID=2888524 RepID=UPI001F03B7E2|nr:DUF488 domain-containing protein [Thermomonas flagellata]